MTSNLINFKKYDCVSFGNPPDHPSFVISKIKKYCLVLMICKNNEKYIKYRKRFITGFNKKKAK